TASALLCVCDRFRGEERALEGFGRADVWLWCALSNRNTYSGTAEDHAGAGSNLALFDQLIDIERQDGDIERLACFNSAFECKTKIEFGDDFMPRRTFELREKFTLRLTRCTGAKDLNFSGTCRDALRRQHQ